MTFLKVSEIPQIVAELCAKGARPFTILYKTDANLVKKSRKTGLRHNFGDVSKVCLLNGMLNFEYEKSVNRQRAREDKQADFEASGYIHYEHFDGVARPIVRNKKNKNALYLQIKSEKVIDTRYINSEGQDVEYNELKAADVLPLQNKSVSQGLDKDIEVFAVSLDNVIAFCCDNETYYIGVAAQLQKLNNVADMVTA